ncbi:MAG: citrate lyase holo-[Solobacterium sp.]|nr:citrate lyase holo-[acyl-carrier protein] synthase [Solobacterium sp.]
MTDANNTVSLEEMLEAREQRVYRQETLRQKYGVPLVSFSMNIAGPIKNTPAIERTFDEGLRLLRAAVSGHFTICEQIVTRAKTGCEAVMAVAGDAAEIKQLCVRIEEGAPVGRLFDMDVIDSDGRKLDRARERSCIVCGRPGRTCASRRLHSVRELQEASCSLIAGYWLDIDAEKAAQMIVSALSEEICTTPKPGLVDLNNNGSHKDMDAPLMLKSAQSLLPGFKTAFRIGYENRSYPAEDSFPKLRQAGLEAEKTMLEATSGVNTHKGAIFHFSLISGALGRLYDGTLSASAAAVAETVKAICHDALAKELEQLARGSGTTFGAKMYRQYGIRGARGEAMDGYQTIIEEILPAFRNDLEKTGDYGKAGSIALLRILAATEDTNMIHRGGYEVAKQTKEKITALLQDEITEKILLDLDRSFIEQNLSPGGSADLLGILYFFHELETH